ncbi:MAG: hypothetical protein FJ148_00675 [Deltaproteobacteria bacterium]|nr:hypothetical protein [Deltaproteobacteria bacterium]
MSTTSARQVYFVSGKAVELWENARQPFGWSEEDLDGYAKLGRWDLLFNALVLAHVLDGPPAA